jgi:hypothetical protein
LGRLCIICIIRYIHVSFSSISLYELTSECNPTLTSLEAIARICVSGFIFDPEVSLMSLIRSKGHSDFYPTTPSGPSGDSASRTNSISRSSLKRGGTITQRFKSVRRALLRPFALRTTSSSQSMYSNASAPSQVALTPSHSDQTSYRLEDIQNRLQGSSSSYMSQALKSDSNEVLSLPFQLNIKAIHGKARRNVPYLRQSWTRIDFIAIVSFWIVFALATTGVERGEYHIGIFRALSVIRTARLLTITSGTTVRFYLVLRFFNCQLICHSIDNHALLENGSSTPYSSCLLRRLRYLTIFVSWFQHLAHPKN